MGKLGRAIKLARFKVGQRLNGVQVADEPWFDRETSAWFRGRLSEAGSYMEFGSGGSTRLAARFGVPTISVEGDAYFANAVRKGLADGHKVILLTPSIGLTGLWGVPVPGASTAARVTKWRRYLDDAFGKLDDVGMDFPDLFLVDGRFRRACALRSAYEAKKHGREAELLFDDYYTEDRDHYSSVERFLGEPERLGRSAVFKLNSETAVTNAEIAAAITDFR